MYLVIDTTGSRALVALGDAKGVLSFGEWPHSHSLSRQLQPEIDKLLRLTKRKPQAIICVTGPGSFTGIRLGVATANALGYAWQIPAVAVTRFEIYEQKYKNIPDPKIVLVENIHDLVYAKIYRSEGTDYFVGDYKTLAPKIAGAKIIGEYIKDKKIVSELFGAANLAGDGKVVADKDRAELILRKGEEILSDLNIKTFSLPLTPLYINQPHITKSKK
jgi:tRNA threonylcarbamoyl adenosine modification protein YeaZ